MSKIDLHIHSAASDDGEYTPQELVAMCTAQGMELIAVTDHNSVRSVTAAQSTASSCGLLVLSGVELDCTHKGRNFHLLGYGFDHTRKEFAECAVLLGFFLRRKTRLRACPLYIPG